MHAFGISKEQSKFQRRLVLLLVTATTGLTTEIETLPTSKGREQHIP